MRSLLWFFYVHRLAGVSIASPLQPREPIDRKAVVTQFNPIRQASSNSTPLQLGNGNFAFGADITGLQTFQPFNTLSSWGWHNMSLPTTPNQTLPSDFTGLDWWTHGRLVNYAQPNPAESDISNWMIQNPQRINLGRIGVWFGGKNISEEMLIGKTQELHLWEGSLESRFEFDGVETAVKTWVDPDSDTLAVRMEGMGRVNGSLGVFLDFPYADVNKFDAPFVGTYKGVENHTTTLKTLGARGVIRHDLDATTYYTTVNWEGRASLTGPLSGTHRYILKPANGSDDLSFTVNFSPSISQLNPSLERVSIATTNWWFQYWNNGAFADLVSETPSANATELQRRIILSQYLVAVNSAGRDPPQESGLVNNGWYGKFHLEMVVWHTVHFARWGRASLMDRSLGMYKRFLPTSLQRAADQGYEGARWGKMSDPSGRSAPGEINSLLIWQQPHPAYFAEVQWRQNPGNETLEMWDEILTHTADFMASFAWWNASTGVYDLGPPMYPVSENTKPNITINPTFELAYWRFGLGVAKSWKERQGRTVPSKWVDVLDQLAPLPTVNGTYSVYEGIPNMWTSNTTTNDHPAMSGIFGLLPPTPNFNVTVSLNTARKIKETWGFDDLYGWDFAMLAMNSLRLGDVEQAIDYLLDSNYQFDDAGYAVGGVRVPTPYMPSTGAFLLAVAMMAGGWDGQEGMHFPQDWMAKCEGFEPAM
ncbi:hypothetical protein BP5796_00808 [Coleophoma crateriformis]|uniref:Six-hairpin glycosidase-like protein n=1 Tax=Coleophoma crateriformis TaxID=565419 RepID=A0A3D8T939_9HELO|nr:hypothetical protein BP5796_00808 [Coleophoma crateriformis]